MRFQAWLRRYSLPCTWGAGILIFLAMLLSHTADGKILVTICYLAAFLLAGFPIAFRAFQALRFKTVSIELLVTIAAVGACIIGEFNESAIVTFLFQFGSYLEQKTMKKTRSAIRSLTEMAPSTAWKIKVPEKTNSSESPNVSSKEENLVSGKNFCSYEIEEIDADEVEIGDLLLVKSGNQIASDGIVVKGDGYAQEAGITGESLPKHKVAGDVLYAGTFLDSGTIQMRATKVGEDTTFSKIIELVEEAQDAKSPVERFIDRFAKYYTPAVIVMAALVFLFTGNLDTAITVLVLACPGALVIGAPIANVAGIGRGAKEGVLLKGGDTIHTFSKTDTFVFDKTGTLTLGTPEVSIQKNYCDRAEEVLILAASAEQASGHPLAQAVLSYAKNFYEKNPCAENSAAEHSDIKYSDLKHSRLQNSQAEPSDARSLTLLEPDSVETIKGQGIRSVIQNHTVLVGSRKFMEQNGIFLSAPILHDLKEIQHNGASTVLISVDHALKMLLGISDKTKPDAKDSILRLKKLGISNLLMLTGDNSSTAAAISEQLGIPQYRAELLPADKLSVVQELKNTGKTVTFVGDGINDSPALATADTGIAMGSGTDVAIENSDVVLIQSDLKSLVTALQLARKTVRILYENIAIAVGTVLLLLVGLFAGYIHMSIGMLIHEASILVVIFNAMRLLIPAKSTKESDK